MKTYFYSELKSKLPELVEKIKNLYKDNLIAIVLFGSAASGDLSQSSDIDLLIILKESSKNKRQRILEVYEKVGYEFEGHFLSPNFNARGIEKIFFLLCWDFKEL